MSYLPVGFPVPEREVLDALRRSILATVKTPHPPLAEELAVVVLADQAGVELEGLDPEAVWLTPPDQRAAVFVALGRLLGELAG